MNLLFIFLLRLNLLFIQGLLKSSGREIIDVSILQLNRTRVMADSTELTDQLTVPFFSLSSSSFSILVSSRAATSAFP